MRGIQEELNVLVKDGKETANLLKGKNFDLERASEREKEISRQMSTY